jgi:hypothetical protein
MNDPTAQAYFESIFLSDKERQEGKPTSNAKSREFNQIMTLFKAARRQDLKTATGTLRGAVVLQHRLAKFSAFSCLLEKAVQKYSY